LPAAPSDALPFGAAATAAAVHAHVAASQSHARTAAPSTAPSEAEASNALSLLSALYADSDDEMEEVAREGGGEEGGGEEGAEGTWGGDDEDEDEDEDENEDEDEDEDEDDDDGATAAQDVDEGAAASSVPQGHAPHGLSGGADVALHGLIAAPDAIVAEQLTKLVAVHSSLDCEDDEAGGAAALTAAVAAAAAREALDATGVVPAAALPTAAGAHRRSIEVDSSGLTEGKRPRNCYHYLRGNCRYGAQCHFSHDCEPHEARPAKQLRIDGRHQRPPPSARPSLLKKLLAAEIRSERSMLLQCIRRLVDTLDAELPPLQPLPPLPQLMPPPQGASLHGEAMALVPAAGQAGRDSAQTAEIEV
jgi:hypothetical protein